MNASVDVPLTRRPGISRSHLLGLCVVLLLAAFLTGGATMADASPDVMDLAKIVSVVAFIGSMIALAFGMIGDAYRP